VVIASADQRQARFAAMTEPDESATKPDILAVITAVERLERAHIRLIAILIGLTGGTLLVAVLIFAFLLRL
jgi:xanthine/uracil permease